ncbi:hypothetical protein BDY19DRAFT_95885 [Irpex rosettiformis]|uniref:Uncharacterized protein n=1 Tax=Irpex rosettiformis TaxID=378272 RepID=A0ACB8U7S2_9APHY|nr:hypothetical protein BDY19DRAFT_95885 [Irpex rosettiformis]
MTATRNSGQSAVLEAGKAPLQVRRWGNVPNIPSKGKAGNPARDLSVSTQLFFDCQHPFLLATHTSKPRPTMRSFSLFSRRSQPQDTQSSRSSRRTSYLSTTTTSSDASEVIALELPNLPSPSYASNDCAGSGIAEDLEDDNLAWGSPRPVHRPKRKVTAIAVQLHHRSDQSLKVAMHDKRRQ